MIAALYVRRDGPYFKIAGVDPWDARRDARLWNGPGPVVAHPPCGAWGRYHHLYLGKDKDCALRAVDQVRVFGGVLEHPAESKLWRAAEMPRPGELPDFWGGRTVEINQCDFGHRAEKRTWLYFRGRLPPLPPPGKPTSFIESMGKRERELTPPRLAEWLVEIAKSSYPLPGTVELSSS